MSATGRITARKAGGSIIATIPKEIVDALGIRPGDELSATFEKARDAVDKLRTLLRGIEWDREWVRGGERF